MAVRKTFTKVELTDTIGKTKDLLAIVKGDTAKILCKDRANDWTFDTDEIDQYIQFLQEVKTQLLSSSTGN